jgi:hypothetical protein
LQANSGCRLGENFGFKGVKKHTILWGNGAEFRRIFGEKKNTAPCHTPTIHGPDSISVFHYILSQVYSFHPFTAVLRAPLMLIFVFSQVWHL